MNAPECVVEGGFKAPAGLLPSSLLTLRDLGLQQPTQPVPAGGEGAAASTLNSFLAGRGRDYRRATSSPLTAEESCSRLSEHLAFGTISMRCVHQASVAAIRNTADAKLAHALRGFTGRLRRWLPEWGTAAYPPMLVDERVAQAAAKDMMHALRKTPQARAEADAVQHKHGSRKSGLPSTTRARRGSKDSPPDDAQGRLF